MKKTILSIIFLALFGCELIVDVDVPFDKPQLTLNAIMNPDSVWNAKLTLNRHVLDKEPFKEVDNAQVIVYDGLIPVDTLASVGLGTYWSDNNKKPEIGKLYTIKVAAGNYTPVSATSSIPVATNIISTTFTEDISNDGHNTEMKIRFKDNADETNYYQLFAEVEQEYYDARVEAIRHFYYRYQLTSEDPAIQNENDDYSESIIFRDVFFNGRETELTFKGGGFGPSTGANIKITLRTLSKDFYDYLTTTSLQNNTSGDPFAQPVNVYNNVEGGFGIFAGYSAAAHSELKERPIITGITPSSGKAGDRVTITGENFLPTPQSFISVGFKSTNGYMVSAQVLQKSENQLEVIVPPSALSGKIVFQNGRVAISDTEFIVN
jgi:hypothetical protein